MGVGIKHAAILFALPLLGVTSACKDIAIRPSGPPLAVATGGSATADLAALERRTGGRLGVQVMRIDGEVVLSHRNGERFAMCSAFKLPMAGVVLDAVQRGQLGLQDVLPYTRADVLSHSPVLTQHLRGDTGQVTVEQALAAAVTFSDNGATNLLLARIGGPQGLTAAWRDWGDATTRLDRTETTLNENRAGDPRDSSTPRALSEITGAMLYGQRLSAQHRALLRRWTRESTTGSARFRAGLSSTWASGDKTGTCADFTAPNAQINDIVWFEGADGQPYVFAVMLDRPTASGDVSQAAMAEVARIAALSVTRLH